MRLKSTTQTDQNNINQNSIDDPNNYILYNVCVYCIQTNNPPMTHVLSGFTVLPLCKLYADLTQRPPDLVQLVHVRLPGPQRDPRQQLGKHAADGPHVHRGAVLGVSHQQLGGPVPTGGHVVRVVVTWSS